MDTMIHAAAAQAQRLREGLDDDALRARGHRGVMAAAMTAVVAASDPASPLAGDLELVRSAAAWVAELAALQAGDGLFAGGDNLASPPDSAFTINAAASTVLLLHRPGAGWPDDLADRLLRIVAAAAPALHAGGVHTPNHRWELASAVARCAVLLDEPRLLGRARVWLAEGVDVDADGLYSERSANYAARVTNPALTVLADLLDRPDLHDVVHHNLHAHLDLADGCGYVETVHSRRQDQGAAFPLGPFLGQLRRAAIQHTCSRCAAGARHATTAPEIDAVQVRAEQLMDPVLAEPLPGGADPGRPRRRLYRAARLLRVHRPSGVDITVYGGSDVPAVGRIGSGLACNPTFLRMRLGAASVESLRLSRDFFGLGPFRASDMTVDGDRVVLTETVHASYYQPLTAGRTRPDGEYTLEHEGRFAAAMSFSQRRPDTSTLDTRVELQLHDDGIDIAVTTAGAATGHSLEIALAPGGELVGAQPFDGDRYELVTGSAEYRCGEQVLVIGPGAGSGPDRPPGYRPGEAYTWTGGTDAVGGTRLYVSWRSPGTTSISLRCLTPNRTTVRER